MRTSSIRAGDIVCASKRGRLFHAKVIEVDAAGSLLVEPIERNISYRHVQASEITEHWSRSSSTRRAAREPKAQATLEFPLALLIEHESVVTGLWRLSGLVAAVPALQS